MMELFGIMIGLLVLAFFLLWNVFAVVGIILTIKYFVEKLSNRSGKPQAKPKIKVAKEHKEPVTQQKLRVKKDRAVEEGSETNMKSSKVKEQLKAPLDKSSILLYTGAFLVGFAIFIFVAYSWDSFSDSFKTFLSVAMVLVFYLLAFLFSTQEMFKKVSKTFLFLASISVVFAGAGIWKFAIEDGYNVQYEEFWFVYSILMVSIFGITYEKTKSKVYFIFALLSGYYALISSTFILQPANEDLTVPYLLAGNALIAIILDYTLKRRELYTKIVRRIAIVGNLLLNLAALAYVASESYHIDTPIQKMLVVLTLALPFLFTLFLYWRDRGEKKGLLVEGLLLPFKLFLLSDLFILDSDTYHYLGISLILFISSVGLTFTNTFKKSKGVKYFTIPLIVSSTATSLFLPFESPTSVRTWDPLPMAITYAVISVAIQLKATKGKAVWLRFLNIPLDLIAFILFIGAVEYRLDVGLSEPYLIGALLLIPMAIYYTEWAIYRKKTNIPQLTGSIIFLLLATLLVSSEPIFLFGITAIGVAYFFITTIISRKIFFLIPLFIYAFLNTWSGVEAFEWEPGLGMIFSVLLLIFFGNLWRLEKYFKVKDPLALRSFDLLQKTALITSAPFVVLTGIMVFNGETVHVIVTSMLISIFYLTAYNKYEELKYLSGIGYVFAFWSLLQISDTPPFANAQMYAFPVVIYSLVMAYFAYPRSKPLSTFFKTFSYMLPMTIALVQSITDPDPFRLLHGLLLITISVILMVYGVMKKDKLLTWIPLVYIVIELIILLWDIIVSTPWWLYLGVLGMTLIGLSVWVIYKVTQSSEKGDKAD
jgi:hypothetical protein